MGRSATGGAGGGASANEVAQIKSNTSLLTLNQNLLMGSVVKEYSQQAVDLFGDETGVTTKTDLSYDAVNNRYFPTPAGSYDLLVQSETTDGSTTFTDTTSGHTVTANGDAKHEGPKTHTVTANGVVQHSTAQAKFGSSAIYFDGTDDYLSAPDSSDFNLGANEFTIQAWVSPSDLTNAGTVASQWDTTGDIRGWAFRVASSGALQFTYSTDGISAVTVNSATSLITTGTWFHVVAEKSGTTLTLYIDGVSVQTADFSAVKINDSSAPLSVGRSQFVSASTEQFIGYMEEVAITNGTAEYTTAFTPPASPLSAGGNYNLLIQSETTNGSTTFTDSSSWWGLSKFGSSAIYFDGTGDYLSVPDHSDFNLGAGEFTIQAWVRLDNTTGFHMVASQWETGDRGWYLSSSGQELAFGYSTDLSNSNSVTSASTPLSANTWHHVTAEKSGTTLTLYVDGVAVGTADFTSVTISNSTQPCLIGANNAGAGNLFQGYMEEVAITTGTTEYGVSPSRTAKTLVKTGGIDHETRAGFINPAPIRFDGVDDKLSITDNTQVTELCFGSSEFTVETFVEFDAIANGDTIFSINGTPFAWDLIFSSDTTLRFRVKESTTFYSVDVAHGMTAGNRYHVAGVRDVNTLRLYINGVEIGSTAFSGTINDAGASTDFSIGAYISGSSNPACYMENIRISDTCRYPSGTTFVPTTTNFVNDANTLLLVPGDRPDGSTFIVDTTAVITAPTAPFTLTRPNVTFVSDSFTAGSDPAQGDAYVLIQRVLDATPNTNILVDMTRDGGTTWETGTLSYDFDFYDIDTAQSYEVWRAEDIALSGQPSGTSVALRLTSANNPNFYFKGWLFQWA